MSHTIHTSLSDALREALLSDSTSYAEVSRQTGLARPSLMSFAKGHRSLRLDLADKLAAYYRVEIILPTKET
ncbi:hypothetical protein Pla175_01300 [Pirellulimonas nuda]|uniref:HTH cro/C1-type domain-containing protein n=1 Tax=Pirellulimonas nuda TaxID=2528009 RepID=A0A518D5P2_9BACT|nr:helix-turn-helix transcriptional regulator [Pirellulimonas nuda]QDU86779.1 hypothetical protein Pla175_01300 [Pirellulimonas nuda]